MDKFAAHPVIHHLLSSVHPLFPMPTSRWGEVHIAAVTEHNVTTLSVGRVYEYLLLCWNEEMLAVFESDVCRSLWREYLKRGPITAVRSIQTPRPYGGGEYSLMRDDSTDEKMFCQKIFDVSDLLSSS
jgi:hypothetical protein